MVLKFRKQCVNAKNCYSIWAERYQNETQWVSHKYDLKGHVTGLYKPVGGAGESFCKIPNMLHISEPFFKFKKLLQII